MAALVQWSTEKNDFDLPIFNYTIVFHDRFLGLINRQMQMQAREGIWAQVQHSVRIKE